MFRMQQLLIKNIQKLKSYDKINIWIEMFLDPKRFQLATNPEPAIPEMDSLVLKTNDFRVKRGLCDFRGGQLRRRPKGYWGGPQRAIEAVLKGLLRRSSKG